MKAKTAVIVGLLIIFASFSLIPANAWAGSPQSHRWEGVAIGVGAAIIGTALLQAYQNGGSAAYVYQRPMPPPVPAGHWEIQQAWVPPVYEKTWNPGHYDRRGRWIPGQWIQIQTQSGYWTENRVWVPAR